VGKASSVHIARAPLLDRARAHAGVSRCHYANEYGRVPPLLI